MSDLKNNDESKFPHWWGCKCGHELCHRPKYKVIGSHADGSWLETETYNKEAAVEIARSIHERSAGNCPSNIAHAAVFYGSQVVNRCC